MILLFVHFDERCVLFVLVDLIEGFKHILKGLLVCLREVNSLGVVHHSLSPARCTFGNMKYPLTVVTDMGTS